MKKALAKLLVAAVAMMAMTGVVSAASDNDSHTVTTYVQDTLTFTCGTAVDLGTVTSSASASNTATCSVTSNDEDGYTVQIESDNSVSTAGLYNSASTSTLDATAPSGMSIGTDGFTGYVSASDTDQTPVAGFDGSAGTTALTTTAQNLLTGADQTDGTTEDFTMTYRADVDGSTPSGYYVTTITYTVTST